MATANLSRTMGTATNRNIFTLSMWVKMSKTGSDLNDYQFCDFYVSGSIRISLYHNDDDTLRCHMEGGGSYTNNLFTTNAKLRDTNAWYHLVWRFDTTQATASDRIRLYINGELATFSDYNPPAQNFNLQQGTSSYTQYLGRYGGATDNNFDGQMAHVHFTDGYSYAASTFGETDATTGIWKPKTAPSVTYGNNGFFLKFENSGAMGTDSAGSNNFAVNGTMTKLIDTPSNVFATWNLLFPQSQYGTYTNGNTSVIGNNNTYASRTNSTLAASSGKYYMEFKIIDVQGSSYPGVGMISTQNAITEGQVGGAANSVSYRAGGTILTNGSTTATENSYTDNDIIGVAMDLDNGAVYFHKNGTYQNNGNPTSGSSKTGSLYSFTPGTDTYHFGCTLYQADSELSANFGNGYFGTTAVSSAQNPDDGIGIFEYDVPAGYRALCTKSINEQEYS